MRKILRIPIPFEQIDGYAIASKTIEMNDIQKRVTAMIMHHEELGISTLTLNQAISKVLGIKDFNIHIIREDIRQLVNKNFGKLVYPEPKGKTTKVAIYYYAMNKDIKSSIDSSFQFNLLADEKRTIKSQVFLPLFESFENFTNVNNLVESPKIDFKEDFTYKREQKEDILSSENHKQLKTNEVIKIEELNDPKQRKIVWKSYEVELEINDKEICSKEQTGNEILLLINKNKINFSLEKLLNESIDKQNIKELNGEIIEYKEFENMTHKLKENELIEHKFITKGNDLLIIGHTSKKIKMMNKIINFKQAVMKKISAIEIIKQKSKKVTISFIELFKDCSKIISFILENNIKVNIEINVMLSKLNYDDYVSLTKKTRSKILKNKIVTFDILRKFVNNLSKENLVEISELSTLTYEEIIKVINIVYEKPIFSKWSTENEMFNVIEKVKSIDEKQTKKELEKIRELFNSKKLGILFEQKIIKTALNKLDIIIKSAPNWSEKEILDKADKLKTQLEKISLKIGNKTDTFINRWNSVKEFKSKKILSIYQELSNDYQSLINKNLKKAEDRLKQIIEEMNLLFPIKKQDLKKEVKNVT